MTVNSSGNHSDDEATRTAQEVQAEIAETRAELDDTLEEIAKRLSPQEIKARAVEYAKDSATDLSDAVQRNPWPLALTVAGVIATTVYVRRRRSNEHRRLAEEQLQAMWESASRSRTWDRMVDALGAARNSASGQLAHVAESSLSQAGDAASEIYDRTGELATHARRRLAQGAGSLAMHARDFVDGDAAQHVIQPARRIAATIEDTSRERPWVALGAATLTGAMLMALMRR